MVETAYAQSRYKAPEIEHRYGPNVHLLDDPLAWTQLARLCARETVQPEVGQLVRVALREARAGGARGRVPARARRGADAHGHQVTRGRVSRRRARASHEVRHRRHRARRHDALADRLRPPQRGHRSVRRPAGSPLHVARDRRRRQGHRRDVARREDRPRRRGSHPHRARSDGRDRLVDQQRADALQDAARGQAADLHHDAPRRHAGVHPQRAHGASRDDRSTRSVSTAVSRRRRSSRRSRARTGTRSAGSTSTSTSSRAPAASARS